MLLRSGAKYVGFQGTRDSATSEKNVSERESKHDRSQGQGHGTQSKQTNQRSHAIREKITDDRHKKIDWQQDALAVKRIYPGHAGGLLTHCLDPTLASTMSRSRPRFRSGSTKGSDSVTDRITDCPDRPSNEHNQARSDEDLQLLSEHHNHGQGDSPEQNNIPVITQTPMELRPHNQYVVMGLKLMGCFLLLMYFIIPIVVKLNPWLMNEMVFLPRLRWPPFINLSNPEEFGLNSTRSFRINISEEISLGAWHVLPGKMKMKDENMQNQELFIKELQQHHPVILYLHGNAGTRGGWHRVQLYKVLSKIGFHVITFDYRGFGDSTGYPTEDGVCEDSLAAYNYIQGINKNATIYLWGHSLGSGVATKVAKQLCDNGLPLKGLILEAPFNNILEAANTHPFTLPFRVMPWFTWAFIEGLTYNRIYFATDQSIAAVTVPTLILHAKDDGIVPFNLGKELHKKALLIKKTGGVQFVHFDGSHGYGHKHIHKAPELPKIIKNFADIKD